MLQFSSYSNVFHAQMAAVQLHSGNEPNKVLKLITTGNIQQLQKILGQGREEILDWVDTRNGQTFLHIAGIQGRAEVVDLFVLNGTTAWINAQDTLGNTALHLAVANSNEEAVKRLLASTSINGNVENNVHETAFHVAIKLGDRGVACVRLFLEVSGPWIAKKIDSNLHIIARHDNLEAFKVTIAAMSEQNGGNPAGIFLSKNKWGATIMHVLARMGAHSIMEYVLEECASFGLSRQCLLSVLSYDSKFPLHYSVEGNHVESVKCLLRHGADCTLASGNNSPPIHTACFQDQFAILKVMVETQGCDVLKTKDGNGRNLLHSSVFSICNENFVSFLLANGLGIDDQDNDGVTPLAQAVLLGNVDGVKIMLKNGANVFIKDNRGFNVLLMSVDGQKLEVFRSIVLHEKAAELVQDANCNGVCPIHIAIQLGMKAMIEPLLKLVDKRAFKKDAKGNTCLHLAAISGNVQMLGLIYGLCKSMLNNPNKEGFTPLHFAAMQPYLPVVQELLNHGATVHKNDSGCTPFMLACQKGYLEIAQDLLSNSSFQKDWTDHQGNSALHMAVEGKNPNIVTYCLDQNVSIGPNSQGDTFFHHILQAEDAKLAEAALKHTRWPEYFKDTSPHGKHILLSIIERIPEAYQIVLDQCYTTSSHDKSHGDYWEEFNFLGVNSALSNDPTPDSVIANSDNTRQILMEPLLPSEEHNNIDVPMPTNVKKLKSSLNPLEVPLKLIGNKYKHYLLHPVMNAFIESRWRGFGQYYIYSKFVCILILGILSTVLTIQLPPSNQASERVNATSCLPNISIGLVSAFYLSILASFINLGYCFVDFFIHYNSLFRLCRISYTWPTLIAPVCITIYSISILAEIKLCFRLVLAIGVCFSWFSVGFSMQIFRFFCIGVYITIIIRTTQSVFKLLVIILVFIIGLALPLHILVSSADLPLSSVGISIFATFSNLIGLYEYDDIITMDVNGQLQNSVAVFFLLVVIIVVLPIVMINVILGLVLGDISKLQQDAAITHRIFEIQALYDIEKLNSSLRLFPHLSRAKVRRYNKGKVYTRLSSLYDSQWPLGESAGVPKSDSQSLIELLMQERNELDRKMQQLQESEVAQFQAAIERLEAMMMKKSN